MKMKDKQDLTIQKKEQSQDGQNQNRQKNSSRSQESLQEIDLSETSKLQSLTPATNSKEFWVSIGFFAIVFMAICVFVSFKEGIQTKSIQSSPEEFYDLIKLNSTSALCLDGSPGSYYLSRTGDLSKILIYFAGGAWCGSLNEQMTLESCYNRSKTKLGSSNFHLEESNFTVGILSKDERNYFKNWKKVIFHYCDGSGHQGTRKQPIQYKDKLLYFRGHNITVQKFDELQNKLGLFSKSSKVVISGTSAGGLAAFMWTNYLKQKVQKGKVWSIPDAGIFHDSQNTKTKRHDYRQSFVNLMKFSNQQIDLPVPQCLKEFPNDKANCMLAEHIHKHIKTPVFAVQSVYDKWSIESILGLDCIVKGIQTCTQDDRKLIEKDRIKTLKVLQEITQKPQNGVWGNGCVRHGTIPYDSFFEEGLGVQELTENSSKAYKVIERWIQHEQAKSVYLDSQPWFQGKPCYLYKHY